MANKLAQEWNTQNYFIMKVLGEVLFLPTWPWTIIKGVLSWACWCQTKGLHINLVLHLKAFPYINLILKRMILSFELLYRQNDSKMFVEYKSSQI